MEYACNQFFDTTKLNEGEKIESNTKGNEIKLYMEKQKKERSEKDKLNLLKKQKFVEDRKKKLAELHKKIALIVPKRPIKKKKVQDECITSQNVLTKSNQLTEVNQVSKETLDIPQEIPIDIQNKKIEDLEITNYNDSKTRLKVLKSNEKIHSPTSEKISKCKIVTPQIDLTEKSTVNIDTTSCTEIQLLDKSLKNIINRIDNLKELQKLLIDKVMSSKICYSNSTQTEDLSVLKCKHNLQNNVDIKYDTLKHLKCNKNNSKHRSSPDYSIDDELDDHSISKDDNSKIILNTEYSTCNIPTPVSKLSTLSTSMITENDIITNYSKEMLEVEQLIQAEELKAKQHQNTLSLKENSLRKRLKVKVAMTKLQIKDLNQPSHEKHLHSFKKKQRDEVKKLELLLSQMKSLSEIIEFLHKQRICLLKEHLQNLKTQSSFQNIDCNLESLDEILEKAEYKYARRPNPDFIEQCNKADLIGETVIEKEYVNQNLPKIIAISENNNSQTKIELHNPSIISSRYKGLVNHGMTCYLNSILQVFYMTPEFRNALYQLKFDFNTNIDWSNSISFQLQKLFLNLQTSSSHIVKTTELIRSLGWNSSEVKQQHDVQECRSFMLDALEREFKNTIHVNLIKELYQGKMIDYVKCLECGIEKSRKNTFLEVHLPIRPFGSTNAYGCIIKCLQQLTESEVLSGDNQLLCERCNKKCYTHKRLKFSKFPYILTLHLMRFDYNSEYPIKLNDKVVFPLKLNLNSFISNYKNGRDRGEPLPEEFFEKSFCRSSNKCVDNNYSGTDVKEDMNSSQYQNGGKCGVGLKSENAPVGPYIYELYALIIHSGSALEGHYYAYIKDFKTNKWLCFDDQSVSVITVDDIKKNFGGSSQSESGTNAYMLMYRKIDPKRNKKAMSQKDFPPHLKELYTLIKKKSKANVKMKEIKRHNFEEPIHSTNFMQCGDGVGNY